MFKRHLAPHILKATKEYPILAIIGPRQSGKTTLVKSLFPSYKYVSLEDLDLRQHASTDPRGFLDTHGPFLILDEAQRVPELFPYLQGLVDQNQKPGQYILTGSSQFLLMEKIAQSLAGRVAHFKLYPLTYLELRDFPQDKEFESVFRTKHASRPKVPSEELHRLLWEGFFPRIHDQQIESSHWYENYVITYVERDVRSLLNVKDLRLFEQFLLLIATQSGQLLNYTNLSNSLGISIHAIKQWISILETSGVIFILSPYFQNFSKRVVKTPKLYFVDTGMLCYLLSIRSTEHLKTHPLLGHIFETFMVSECFKRFHHMGEKPPLYFWRDQSQMEIDLLIHYGTTNFPIEIKLSQTFHSDFKKNLEQWQQLQNNPLQTGEVIYCGEHVVNPDSQFPSIPWYLL